MAAWDESRVAARDTLCAVLKEFKEKGVQGITGAHKLTEWVKNLPPEALKEMCEIDKETTLQILVDCFGVGIAFKKYINADPEICKQALVDAGYIIFVKAENENELAAKRERFESLEADYKRLASGYMEEYAKNERLEKENTALKAALFDRCVETGQIKIPGWEEGSI